MPAHLEGNNDVNAAVMGAGKESLRLIQQYLSGRASRNDLSRGLSEINNRVGGVLSTHWEELTSEPRFVPHWQVLQTLKGIVDELEFQLGEYGESTLYDDVKEIALNLKRIADQIS